MAPFTGSVLRFRQTGHLDTNVPHGDGTTAAAKNGSDNVVIFCDRNCNVIAPLVSAPGNHTESPMFRETLPPLKAVAKAAGLCLRGAIISLDCAYDCKINRKAIFNRGMTPNINPILAAERLQSADPNQCLKTIAYAMINLRHFCQP